MTSDGGQALGPAASISGTPRVPSGIGQSHEVSPRNGNEIDPTNHPVPSPASLKELSSQLLFN